MLTTQASMKECNHEQEIAAVFKVHKLIATQDRELLNCLNLESGRVYTTTIWLHQEHLQKTGNWLRPNDLEKLSTAALGGSCLHSHSVDAAQQALSEAQKTARACRKMGLKTKFPWKKKKWRTTVWKNTGIRCRGDHLLLALSRGNAPIRLALPEALHDIAGENFRAVRLVYNQRYRRYEWHLCISDATPQLAFSAWGGCAKETPVSVDLGEIHPAVLCDGKRAVLISCRQLRSQRQKRNKILAHYQSALSRCKRGSGRWQELTRKKWQRLNALDACIRDLEHKVTAMIVRVAVEMKATTLVVGDVRNIADGKRLHGVAQQKVSQWSHGRQRQQLEYKTAAAGFQTVLQDEAYTSQTCPGCGNRQKPKGRVYSCPACGYKGHRDAVGAMNILSKYLTKAAGNILVDRVSAIRPFIRRPSGHRTHPQQISFVFGATERQKQVSPVSGSSPAIPGIRIHRDSDGTWINLPPEDGLMEADLQEATGL